MLTRRKSLLVSTGIFSLAALALVGCGNTQTATTLAQAQAYADALVDAAAAAVATLDQSNIDASVKSAADAALAMAQSARDQLKTITASDLSTAKSIANTVLTALTSLASIPQIMALLGPAGSYFMLGLAVIRAFIANLQLPPNAPANPPPQLHVQAVALRSRLHN